MKAKKHRPTGQRWHKLYGTRRWQRRARLHLRQYPLCAMCLENHHIVAANVADHIDPHHGDEMKFYYGPLQSLCFDHHNKTKQQLEKKGFTTDIGPDGWPTHPNHPANRT